MGCLDANDEPGEPKMIVECVEMPFIFDERKVFQHARKPAAEEMKNSTEAETEAHMP